MKEVCMKNSFITLACLISCISTASCDAMHVKQIKNIVCASKNIFQKQVREYSIEKIKKLYCFANFYALHLKKPDTIKEFIFSRTQEIYGGLPNLREKYNLLYLLSYHAHGFKFVGDCSDEYCKEFEYCGKIPSCNPLGRKYSALVHELLLKQYKKECEKEGVKYYFPGTYEKEYEISRDKR